MERLERRVRNVRGARCGAVFDPKRKPEAGLALSGEVAKELVSTSFERKRGFLRVLEKVEVAVLGGHFFVERERSHAQALARRVN
jgi:hypothetical protein